MEKQKERLLQECRMMGIRDERVLDAIYNVKRELFVAKDMQSEAYGNYPLPIGQGQTISQPYTVAFMIGLLNIRKGDKVLEIGAGCGYNAAVMSYLGADVISIELEGKLCKLAENNLKKAEIDNVKVICADGYHGYEEEAPFDRIIVTCAAEDIPKPLVKQLRPEGIMVIPVTRMHSEVMTRIVKGQGITEHGSFSFVPLRRKLYSTEIT